MNNNITDIQIDNHLAELAKSNPLESYCNNCGDCCSPSVIVKSSSRSPFRILVNDLQCKFHKAVDGEKSCSVYSDRFSKAPWCMDLKGMIKSGVAPGDCPYVETLHDYKPAIKLDEGQYGSVLPLLRKAISDGDTSPFDGEDMKKFLGE